ncbi:putative mitochondrial protein [Vitis vinifera]|uniref:Putative mitochondrial protein n=1 Tax=Vitis vinifera TaxID=29760 RepID=A0A438I537_VITVI|nr:putative mitochondrial protein [Vitis vinifera]
MSIFKYLPVSQHFPLIAPPTPTSHICDVDDVGDTDDPLSGQSECDSDSDTEDRKVSPISGSTELIDFEVPDQSRELKIGSFLSPDERSRLIDLLRSYLDVFAWSYEDMPGLDPTIVQHHLPILPHARPHCRAFDLVLHGWIFWVMPFGLKNAGATYQRAATTLFHDIMHRDVEAEIESKKCTFGVTSGKFLRHIVSERGIKVDHEKIRAILDMPTPRTEREIRGFLGRLQYTSLFIARLTNICEPIFHLLRKNHLQFGMMIANALSRRLRSVSSLLQF